MTERLWDKKVQRDDEMYDSDEEIEAKSRKMADENFGATGILTAVSAKNPATRQSKEQTSSEMPSGGVSTGDGASLKGRLSFGGATDMRTNSRALENQNPSTSMDGIDEHVNAGIRRSGEVILSAGSAGHQVVATSHSSNNRATGMPAEARNNASTDGDGDVDMAN